MYRATHGSTTNSFIHVVILFISNAVNCQVSTVIHSVYTGNKQNAAQLISVIPLSDDPLINSDYE